MFSKIKSFLANARTFIQSKIATFKVWISHFFSKKPNLIRQVEHSKEYQKALDHLAQQQLREYRERIESSPSDSPKNLSKPLEALDIRPLVTNRSDSVPQITSSESTAQILETSPLQDGVNQSTPLKLNESRGSNSPSKNFSPKKHLKRIPGIVKQAEKTIAEAEKRKSMNTTLVKENLRAVVEHPNSAKKSDVLRLQFLYERLQRDTDTQIILEEEQPKITEPKLVERIKAPPTLSPKKKIVSNNLVKHQNTTTKRITTAQNLLSNSYISLFLTQAEKEKLNTKIKEIAPCTDTAKQASLGLELTKECQSIFTLFKPFNPILNEFIKEIKMDALTLIKKPYEGMGDKDSKVEALLESLAELTPEGSVNSNPPSYDKSYIAKMVEMLRHYYALRHQLCPVCPTKNKMQESIAAAKKCVAQDSQLLANDANTMPLRLHLYLLDTMVCTWPKPPSLYLAITSEMDTIEKLKNSMAPSLKSSFKS